jgi:hypothetical protein
MVDGMAMARVAARMGNTVDEIGMLCAKGSWETPVSGTVHNGTLVSDADVIPTFTPLHSTGLCVETAAYDMIVWGSLPL